MMFDDHINYLHFNSEKKPPPSLGFISSTVTSLLPFILALVQGPLCSSCTFELLVHHSCPSQPSSQWKVCFTNRKQSFAKIATPVLAFASLLGSNILATKPFFMGNHMLTSQYIRQIWKYNFKHVFTFGKQRQSSHLMVRSPMCQCSFRALPGVCVSRKLGSGARVAYWVPHSQSGTYG